jgi:hypothetical protein
VKLTVSHFAIGLLSLALTRSIGNVFSTDIDGPVTAAALNAPKQTQCDQILRRNPAAPAIAVG